MEIASTQSAGLGPPRMGFRGNGGTDVQGKCGPAQVDAPHKRPPDAHVFPRLGPLTGDGNSFLILTTPNITSEVTAGLMESSLSSLSLSLLTVAKSPRFQLYLKVVCWVEHKDERGASGAVHLVFVSAGAPESPRTTSGGKRSCIRHR
uniref:Uncharacterized protein n=1 Tax=Timema shepardi TaxID=629360 RepID=A0A7R9B540_TIMSH|nr:unnamed protein product [Timema shepardi]